MPGPENIPNIPTPDNPTDWGYTLDAMSFKKLRENKRFLIGRGTSVLEGQYAGNYCAESIVVDYEREKGFYDSFVDRVIESCKFDGVIQRDLILQSVFDIVKETLKYSQEGVNDINVTESIKPGDKISLAYYMQEGTGVCRHQALMATMILELLKNRGIISGEPSVERNEQWIAKGEKAGHAWARYTNRDGQVYILDVAQGFIGTLEESVKRKEGWNYLRTEERDEVRRRSLGVNATGLIVGVPEF